MINMTKYIEAFTWTNTIDNFLRVILTERPLLHVCAGKSDIGDVTIDKFTRADITADMCDLPFKDNSFRAVFCDPPWDCSMRKEIARALPEMLRVSEIVYIMSPWIWGSSKARLINCWVRYFPGINNAILISKYLRKS
jgi:hypothetical protein